MGSILRFLLCPIAPDFFEIIVDSDICLCYIGRCFIVARYAYEPNLYYVNCVYFKEKQG